MKEIKVAGIVYEVEECENMLDRHSALGQVNYHQQVILIDKGLPTERKEETLIHEVLHACFFEAGFEEQDEDMINRVGKVLYQVLKDNPDLLQPKRFVYTDCGMKIDMSGDSS